MSSSFPVEKYWQAIADQNSNVLKQFFDSNATIFWHNTNEKFTADEFIMANCKYPGNWQGIIKKIHYSNDTIICVVNIQNIEKTLSFHVTSFMKILNKKIIQLDEYWGEDGQAPNWRKEMNIGKPIE